MADRQQHKVFPRVRIARFAVILLFWFQAFGLLLILGVLLNHALEVTAEQEP